MDTPFRKAARAPRVALFGCLVGLIWFGSLGRARAQLQLPAPNPTKERQESKVEPKPGESRLERPKAEDAVEGKSRGRGQKDDEEKREDPKATERKPPEPLLPTLAGLRTLKFGECLRMAHERSPILKSLRIKVESALTGQRGIDQIHNLISPDLKYRKQQAAKGIVAARTELMQGEHDVTFNVARTYYSAVYAKEQMALTMEVEKSFRDYLAFVKDAVAEGSVRTITKKDEEVLTQYVARATDKRIQAESGYRRAMEGLKHEMGFCDEFAFTPADEALPRVDVSVTAEVVVAQALHRRGEIALAQIGVQVLELEVLAQGAVRFRLRQSTAAAASDVHARPVPSGTRDGEYRPDAIVPDFPTLIVGDREIRSERATWLKLGQETLLEKTRDLVKLEALNALIRFETESRRVPELKLAADAGKSSVERANKDSEGKYQDAGILTLEGLSAESRGLYNEARFQQLMALASLERATAGGIRVDYPGR